MASTTPSSLVATARTPSPSSARVWWWSEFTPSGPAPTTEARLIGDIANLLAMAGDIGAASARYVEAIARSRAEEERLLLGAERAQWLWNEGAEREARPIRIELAEIGARRGRRIRSLALQAAMVRAMVGESRFAEAEPLARLVARHHPA